MAPIMMDFPAPVSPVTMFKPGAKVIVNLSMMAKFLIVSSASMGLYVTSPLAPWAFPPSLVWT